MSISVHTSSPPMVELPEKTVHVQTWLVVCFRRAPTFCSRGFSTPQRAASLKSNSPLELASYYRFLLRDGGGEKCSYFSAGRHHPEGRAGDGSGRGGGQERSEERSRRKERRRQSGILGNMSWAEWSLTSSLSIVNEHKSPAGWRPPRGKNTLLGRSLEEGENSVTGRED